MNNLKIGHFTDQANGTGVTVFLFGPEARGAYLICGSAPATRELAVLDPENSVPFIHGLIFTGGSAFGLSAAGGVMQYLQKQEIGQATPAGLVPIVPGASLFDLSYVQNHAPNAAEAYTACESAYENNIAQGQIGAGTGATIGKIIPNAKHMTGGFGIAELSGINNLIVRAYAAVNCIGDIYNEKGQIIAGGVDANGQFIDANKALLQGNSPELLLEQTNTTLICIVTNAVFDKGTLKRICKMAVAGIGRAIAPVFTCYDGDIIFCISNGNVSATEFSVGVIAAEAVRLAILNAVKNSRVI